MQHADVNTATQPASSAGQQPGEYSHYYINLLTLFGQQKPVDEIAALARAAVAHRDAEIARFADQLEDLYQNFIAQEQQTGQRATQQPERLLQGWDAIDLEGLRRQHGGLLIALFHYGAHRQVFVDLPAQALPFVAPVAKQAYFDCTRVTSRAPVEFESAMGLIEVEDPRVGRTMLQALRGGRIGVIYVDGNMGPDGHKVEEGGVEVEFLGRRIKVKAGIARLAHSLGLPVLPLSVRGDPSETGKVGRVVAGDLLLPPPKGTAVDGESSKIAMMQSIYDCLAHEVQNNPSIWEFAFCLHRWVVAGASSNVATISSDDTILQPGLRLSLPRHAVALFERDEQQFWVHVGQQKAFKLPQWAHGLHAYLNHQDRPFEETAHWLAARHNDAAQIRELLGGLHRRGLLAAA